MTMAQAPTFTAEQALADLSGADFLSQNWGDATFFESLGGCVLASVENVSQEGAADDPSAASVLCDAIVENAAYRADLRLRVAYGAQGDGSWSPRGHSVLGVSLRAIAPIQLDPAGRFDPSTAAVEFDEEAQACRVTGAYQPLWFETVSGDPALLYQFDGSVWNFQGLDPASAAVTYESLVGQYDDPQNPGFEPGGSLGCRLVIDSVDGQGAVSGTVTLQSTVVSLNAEPWAATAALTGQAVGSTTSTGGHRVTLTLAGALVPDGTPVVLGAYADGSVEPSAEGGRALKVAWPVVYAYRGDGVTMDALVTEDLSVQLEQVQAAAVPRE